MCFISRKKWKKMEDTIQRLTDIIENREFKKLEDESKELKTIKELLSHVKFKVKNISFFEETRNLQIRYELPIINLQIDENGEPNKDEFFYSVNSLGLISLDDMQKIINELKKVKNNV